MAGLGCTMSLAFVFVLQALTFTGAVKLRHSAIISHLRNTSDRDVIPLPDNNDSPVVVNINLSLVKILDVDRERNEIEVLVWQGLYWNNPALAWDVTKEGFNSSSVSISRWNLWIPDITVYNAVSRQEVVSPPIAVVSSEGTVYFFPSFRVRVWCNLQDVNSHSGANCSLKLGSWTQSGQTVSPSITENEIFMGEYLATPNYEILATSATKESKVYPCCPESYEHIEFTFIVRKHDQPVRVSEEENGSEK